MSWRHIRGVEVSLHSFVTTALNGCDWSASHPGSFTPRKEPWYPQNMKLGGPNSWSECFGKEKSLACTRIWTLDCPASSLLSRLAVTLLVKIRMLRRCIVWRRVSGTCFRMGMFVAFHELGVVFALCSAFVSKMWGCSKHWHGLWLLLIKCTVGFCSAQKFLPGSQGAWPSVVLSK
jgi:hypothetical protein